MLSEDIASNPLLTGPMSCSMLLPDTMDGLFELAEIDDWLMVPAVATAVVSFLD